MISWREKPQWYWLSLAIPVSAVFAFQGGHAWTYLISLIAFILIFDKVLGEHVDVVAPASDSIRGISEIPVAFICAWLLAVGDCIGRLGFVSFAELSGLVVASGILSAFAMAHIHEVMHRDSRFVQMASCVAMAFAGYPHYRLVHDLHHANVGDPRFGSTATMGLSLWRHVVRSVASSSFAVLAADRQRLIQGRVPRLLYPAVLWGLIVIVLTSLYGTRGVVFYIGQSALAIFIVEAIGYIQHYGLVGGNQVAWNVSSWLSNRLFVNNGLHVDHHLECTCPYIRLKCAGATLPAGYVHLFLLALVPPLWFSVMHRLPALQELCVSTCTRKNQE